jgi:hypothetical protein
MPEDVEQLEAVRKIVIDELWHRNLQLSVILSSDQKIILNKFNENHAQDFAVECTRQLGKTYWACAIADHVARENPGCQIKLATAYHTDLESIIIPNFENVLRTCPESLKPKFLSHKSSYRYANGSVIQLVGLDKNPDKLRGNKIRLTIIEEAGFCESDTLKYALESVIAPACLREPRARVILISTPPPEGAEHIFCEKSDELLLKDSYVKITIDDAQSISQLAKEKLTAVMGGRTSISFRRECLLERIIDTERAIIPEFKENVHAYSFERPDYVGYLHKYASLDTGTRDKTVILHGYYDFPKATLFIENDEVLTGAEVTSQKIYDLSEAAEKDLEYADTRRFADSNDPININNISSLGMLWSPTSKDSLAAMVNKLRIWFKDKRIVINPKCKFLIGTLKSALWNKHRTEFHRTKLYGHADAIASLMYMVRNVNESTNPIPVYFGKSGQDHFWRTTQTHSTAVKTLKEAFKK